MPAIAEFIAKFVHFSILNPFGAVIYYYPKQRFLSFCQVSIGDYA